MDEIISRVYIQTDRRNRITRCEGGYTMGNIDNIEDWIYLDEGTGDRYNLCQSHYFEGGLRTPDGIPQWAYENDKARRRTEAEIDADRAEAERVTADRDYAVGEYLTVSGAMYRVLLPILAGSQITPGTNAQETTMEAEMAALNKEESE